ncbi:MAG: 4-alpha-glucanotransferase [Bacteroidales bacterium]|nr:4-alpha-glucanotransferase [Bacteroidales bacterium]
MNKNILQKRHSGILLHPTSLPGNEGIGTLGKNAFSWIDFLEESGQTCWQILPLGHTGFGDSPYQCFSSAAGNPLLIDLEILVKEKWLDKNDVPKASKTQPNRVNYSQIITEKYPILQRAFGKFIETAPLLVKKEFYSFCHENKEWLSDYALFLVIKEDHEQKPWYQWEQSFKIRDEKTIQSYRTIHQARIDFHCFCQWQFFRQWKAVKQYANSKNISIIGDIPIYVSLDSSDAWVSPEIFQFDKKNNPKAVAGVPPDYFSATGQLWGNPVYHWKYLKETGFQWWIERIKQSLQLFDIIRIDHFRGFSAFWSVPFKNTTAQNGSWKKALGNDLFETLHKKLGELPIIAEDLGVITPDVIQLRDKFGFPGMKILQYAFFEGDTGNLPHNFTQNCVVYTGTHDNETTVGWYQNLDAESKNRLHSYLASDGTDIHWKLIRLAMASTANFAIFPMQDCLGLDNESRMNIPSTIGGYNWQWRLQSSQMSQELKRVLKYLTTLFER